jgi:hypothetical protein
VLLRGLDKAVHVLNGVVLRQALPHQRPRPPRFAQDLVLWIGEDHRGVAPIRNFKPASGEQVFLYGGNGTNTFTVTDSGTTHDTFTLGTGYTVFNRGTFVPQVSASWRWAIDTSASTSNNVFNINSVVFGSITGGSGNDTFNVASGSDLFGTIDGGGGTNTLSHSKYRTSGVVVDLLLGTATAIINLGGHGAIAHIQNVTGSAVGGDILVGTGSANVLSTVAGHNSVIGGSGDGDTLTSHGADILIAGTTNYDSNITAPSSSSASGRDRSPATTRRPSATSRMRRPTAERHDGQRLGLAGPSGHAHRQRAGDVGLVAPAQHRREQAERHARRRRHGGRPDEHLRTPAAAAFPASAACIP